MAQDYHHGVRVLELNDGTRPIRTVSSSVVGMVCTASDADATKFPLNTPVLLTNVQAALDKAGDQEHQRARFQAIADQTNPATVVVRVEQKADAAEQTSEIIGGSVNGKYTGMKALLAAEAQLGVKPRILGIPGLDTSAVSVALVSLAQNYVDLPIFLQMAVKPKKKLKHTAKLFGAREAMVLW